MIEKEQEIKKTEKNNKKMVVWALFDSGNGCYKKASEKFKNLEVFSIGIDKENKNNHFINLNLASYEITKKQNSIFEVLDTLPRPDIILASPPCESWSNASSFAYGNVCWKQENLNSLINSQVPLSRFTIRSFKDFKNTKYKQENNLITRINGELCIINTINIIKRYKPKYYVIENPAYGRIWDYIKNILGFDIPYENLTFYSAYGWEIQKPTKFGSNIFLDLKQDRVETILNFKKISGYNRLSSIPLNLIEDIYNKIIDFESAKKYG